MSDENEPDHRFTLANERTFLAWQRTALGLLAVAVAVIQFVSQPVIPGGRFVLGALLAALAVLTSVAGLWRWRQVDRAMRQNTALPRHQVPVYLAAGLGLLAVVVLGVAVVELVGR